MAEFSQGEEVAWLLANPDFRERPATVREFLGPRYLDIEDGIRDSIKEMLAEILGDTVSPERPTTYELAMFSGGIGTGKTSVASIVLPYLCHWCLCLKDPQKFWGLLPGSRIAFMMMSTSARQAREVIFSDVKARLNHSPWFRKFPMDKNYRNQIRFENDIWIIPGDSGETTFEGYNILGGILDEADSHKVTQSKDYARNGWETIYNRMSSRFGDRGFLLTIGQMKGMMGFAAKMYEELEQNPNAYTCRMSIWESRGWDFYRDEDGNLQTFFYDPLRREIVPNIVAVATDRDDLMEIPALYKDQFVTNPEKALKDLAGMPPKTTDPFISQTYKIHNCRTRYVENRSTESPVLPNGDIASWFRATDKLPRVAHLDIAFSGDHGDACGLAMGHVDRVIDYEGELKPYIVMDFLWRRRAPKGKELVLSDIRRLIYDLRDEFGFDLQLITMDSFQSKDTEQQLRRRKFAVMPVSVDKQLLPYYDLREAIYENRLEFPPYLTKLNVGDSDRDLVEILVKELEELCDDGKKVDHPSGGSKDVADAVAGVVTTLMGSRRFHKNERPGIMAPMRTKIEHRVQTTEMDSYRHPAITGGSYS